MSSPCFERLAQLRDVGDMREQAQLDLRVNRPEISFLPSGATKARRMRRPSSVRIGMFCRLGSDEDRRPVVVAAREKEV